MSVSIQTEDFNQESEYSALRARSKKIGAIVTFCGLVREFDEHAGYGLYLEHYPNMTENILEGIIQTAKHRWNIFDAHIIHRIGKLTLGDQIVFVGVNAPHRGEAFSACEFIIDFLKTEAPFWKKALNHSGDYWIEANKKDVTTKNRWQ